MQAALPPNAEHRIIECFGDFAKARVNDALGLDLVAFVDDDDYIDPTSLSLCMNAIETSGLASAITYDALVDLDGKILDRSFRRVRTYELAMAYPRVVHHLFMMKSSLIDSRAIDEKPL